MTDKANRWKLRNRVIAAITTYGVALRQDPEGWLSRDSESTQALASLLDALDAFERVCVDTYREVGT